MGRRLLDGDNQVLWLGVSVWYEKGLVPDDNGLALLQYNLLSQNHWRLIIHWLQERENKLLSCTNKENNITE